VPVYDVAASGAVGISMERILSSYPSLKREHVELAALFAEANPLRGRPRQRELPANARVVPCAGRCPRNPHDQAAYRRMPQPRPRAHGARAGLISVFVQEFGHCHGLPDDTTDPTSLMNPNYVAADIEQVFFPSLSDFQRLRSSLEAYISGSSVGFFDVKNCAGLRRLRSSRVGV
jgi:hypothetical protein